MLALLDLQTSPFVMSRTALKKRLQILERILLKSRVLFFVGELPADLETKETDVVVLVEI